jgi:hypothetical protein
MHKTTPFLFTLLLVLLPTTLCQLTDRGLLNWDNLGTWGNTQVAGGNGGVTVNYRTVSLLQQYEPRVYLMNAGGSTYYRFPNLIGKTITFTVDVSSTTCSCNAAFYLVQFPSGSSNSFYCDAQGSGSSLCNEIDLFEANTHAFQATIHNCLSPGNPCQWGCAWNVKSANGYGPNAGTINTNQPFQVAMSFIGSGSTLQTIGVRLTQNGKSMENFYTDSSCTLSSKYISGLSSAVSSGEFVLAMSYWSSSGMSWLDGCTNGNTCPTSSTISFSSIELENSVTVSNANADSSLTAKESSSSSSSDSFVGSVGFYVLIGVGALVVVVVVALISWKVTASSRPEFA